MGRTGGWGGLLRKEGWGVRTGVWGGREYGAEASLRLGEREPGAEARLGRKRAWGGREYGADGCMRC